MQAPDRWHVGGPDHRFGRCRRERGDAVHQRQAEIVRGPSRRARLVRGLSFGPVDLGRG